VGDSKLAGEPQSLAEPPLPIRVLLRLGDGRVLVEEHHQAAALLVCPLHIFASFVIFAISLYFLSS
jgi:hypothetical protein